LALAAASTAALAQTVISARSGLIHYVEGQVYLGNQQVETKFGSFPEVKENATLRTEEGRAEVLLTPGVFLRLGENSSFRMITNRLIDTRIDVLSGSAVVEAEDMPKDNSVTVVYKDAAVHVGKKGLYRFDAGLGELRVFEGVAEITANDKTVAVKDGHMVALNTLAVRKFDKTETDALNRWSERRAEYVAMANVSTANSLRSSSLGTGGLFDSGWYWNSFLGMYTFVPGLMGTWYSPYGFRYWSPFDVYMAYWPGYYYYPGSYGPTYARAYNGAIAKSVPVPSHSNGAVAGSVSSAHGPSVSRGSGGASGAPAASISPGLGSGAIAHSGGSGAPHH
jgi:hypothetical protein